MRGSDQQGAGQDARAKQAFGTSKGKSSKHRSARRRRVTSDVNDDAVPKPAPPAIAPKPRTTGAGMTVAERAETFRQKEQARRVAAEQARLAAEKAATASSLPSYMRPTEVAIRHRLKEQSSTLERAVAAHQEKHFQGIRDHQKKHLQDIRAHAQMKKKRALAVRRVNDQDGRAQNQRTPHYMEPTEESLRHQTAVSRPSILEKALAEHFEREREVRQRVIVPHQRSAEAGSRRGQRGHHNHHRRSSHAPRRWNAEATMLDTALEVAPGGAWDDRADAGGRKGDTACCRADTPFGTPHRAACFWGTLAAAGPGAFCTLATMAFLRHQISLHALITGVACGVGNMVAIMMVSLVCRSMGKTQTHPAYLVEDPRATSSNHPRRLLQRARKRRTTRVFEDEDVVAARRLTADQVGRRNSIDLRNELRNRMSDRDHARLIIAEDAALQAAVTSALEDEREEEALKLAARLEKKRKKMGLGVRESMSVVSDSQAEIALSKARRAKLLMSIPGVFNTKASSKEQRESTGVRQRRSITRPAWDTPTNEEPGAFTDQSATEAIPAVPKDEEEEEAARSMAVANTEVSDELLDEIMNGDMM